MSTYIATPRATTAPFEPVVVALAANTTKTVLQVVTPAGTDIRVLGWGVSFDGSAAGQPGIAHIISSTGAATVTALTPDLWGSTAQTASLCVGGTTATGYNASAEGTLAGTVQILDSQEVYPQSGYAVWFPATPAGGQPRVANSSVLRIRCKFPAIVNVIPWVVWAEPVTG